MVEPYKYVFSYTRDGVTNAALSLTDGVLDIATSVLSADPRRFFIYRDPYHEDLRVERRCSARYKDSIKSSLRNSKVSDPKTTRKSEESEIEKLYLAQNRLNYESHPTDSNLTLQSRRFSYSFIAPEQRSSYSLSTASVEESRRSTFESIIFKQKRLQAEQESIWNFVMTSSSSESDEETDQAADLSEEDIKRLKNFRDEWQSIDNFTLNGTLFTIRNFVSMWKLSPTTKFTILKEIAKTKGCLGETYHVIVAFSKPTNSCPNPLAVANVNFEIHVSYVMPGHFPVLVTYRFETYRHNYRVMGRGDMRSITFQNYFIDTILNAKLFFYVELFEATHGPISQKRKEFTVDEEYDMYKKQHEIDLKRFLASKQLRERSFTSVVSDKTHRNLSRKSMSRFILSLLPKSDTNYEPWELGFFEGGTLEAPEKSITKLNEYETTITQASDINLKPSFFSVFELETPKKKVHMNMNLQEVDKAGGKNL